MFFLIVYSCLVIVVNTALPYVILNFINDNVDNISIFFFQNLTIYRNLYARSQEDIGSLLLRA